MKRTLAPLRSLALAAAVCFGTVVAPALSPAARAEDKPAPGANAPGGGNAAPAANSGASRAAELGVAAKANQVRGDELTPRAQEAIKDGLEWLAAHQNPDGSYSKSMSSAGITGLAGLAFMANGNLPGRGKYGDNVQKALDFVLKSVNEDGLISADATHGPMYGHGFATLFLGEVYGMTNDETLREKLISAVRLIQRTQNREGGWRYQPQPVDADISVTICEIMALRAARDAGIKVEKQTMDKAVEYVRGCQNGDGGFSYVKGQGTGSGFARSAAGVASLYYAGKFDGPEGQQIKRGLDYLKQFIPNKGHEGVNVQTAEMEGHFFYGNYYAAQAMFLAGGEYWAAWYPHIREQLIRRQREGHWSGDVSDDYATAIGLIILQMPNRYLPVFNGKGPGD